MNARARTSDTGWRRTDGPSPKESFTRITKRLPCVQICPPATPEPCPRSLTAPPPTAATRHSRSSQLPGENTQSVEVSDTRTGCDARRANKSGRHTSWRCFWNTWFQTLPRYLPRSPGARAGLHSVAQSALCSQRCSGMLPRGAGRYMQARAAAGREATLELCAEIHCACGVAPAIRLLDNATATEMECYQKHCIQDTPLRCVAEGWGSCFLTAYAPPPATRRPSSHTDHEPGTGMLDSPSPCVQNHCF